MDGLVVLGACIVVAALILVFLGKGRAAVGGDAGLSTRLDQTNTKLGEVTGRIAEALEGQNKLHATMAERMDAVDRRLNDSLADTAKKTAEALGGLRERMDTIDKAQANLTELSQQVVGLQEILSDKQARGAFGQDQMEAIVSDQIPPGHFEFQAALSNNNRPDCIIRIGQGAPAIVIDSKFPLESFEAYRTAATDADKRAAATRLRADINKHVKDISQKYIIAGETQTPALMFVPAESIYAELHTSFTEVVQKARREQVVIVSPHILMLAVNTIRTLMRDAKMREQAAAIQKEVVLLAKDVQQLGQLTGKLRQHFELTNKDIAEIEKSMSAIATRAGKIESAEIGGDAPTPIPLNEPPAQSP